MRLSFVALTLAAVAACGTKSEPTGEVPTTAKSATAKPGDPPAAPPSVQRAKKPLDTTPLPQLEKDPGGATGKPQLGIGIGGLGTEAPRAVAVAQNGDIYVVGYFDADFDAGVAGKITVTPPDPGKDPSKKPAPTSDAYLAKIRENGTIAWIKTWGGKRDDVATGVAVHGDTIVVVGNFLDYLEIGERSPAGARSNPASGSDDLYAAAFDSNGKSLWVWSAGGIDSDGANAVAAAPDGGWYIGGSFMRVATFGTTDYTSKGGTDAVLFKVSKDGELEWTRQFGGIYNDTIQRLAVDARGNVYVQGHFMTKADWGGTPLVAVGGKDTDIVLAKYDANGDHVWSQGFGSQFDDFAGGLAVDPAGNVTMVGGFNKTISFGDADNHVSNGVVDMFIARFDAAGKLAWAHSYGGEREDGSSGVATDAAGNTVMTGWFRTTIDFGKTTLPIAVSKGNMDAFAIKHDAAGNIVWVQTWGDKDFDQAHAVAIDAKGRAIVVGLYRFTMAIVSPSLESVRAEGDRIPKPDTFVVRLDR